MEAAEFQIDSILAECKGFNEKMDEEIKKNIEDLKRTATVNLGSADLLAGVEAESHKPKETVQAEIKVIEESKTKTLKIDHEITELKNKLTKLEEGKALIKKTLSTKPESTESMTKKLKEYDDICDKISSEFKKLSELKKSVYDKVLKTKDSIKERTLKSVKFFKDVDTKLRHKIEDKVVGILFKEEKIAESTDICFMIDCTGSMQSHINNARDRIQNIIDEVKSTYPSAEIRIAIVAYRDINDANRFEIFKFSESVMDAKNFLSSLVADGGGDTPEDVNGGFQKVYELDWKLTVKTIIHIADAPCHGTTMNGLGGGGNRLFGVKDSYPSRLGERKGGSRPLGFDSYLSASGGRGGGGRRGRGRGGASHLFGSKDYYSSRLEARLEEGSLFKFKDSYSGLEEREGISSLEFEDPDSDLGETEEISHLFGCEDSYPSGHPEDAPWERLLGDLKKKEINYLFLKIGTSPDFMFNAFKKIYDSATIKPNMNLIFQAENLTDDKNLLAKLTITHIKTSIASSLKSTYTKLRHGSKYKEKDISLLLKIDEDRDEESKDEPLVLSKDVAKIVPNWDNYSFFDYHVEATSYYIFGSGTLEEVIKNKISHNTEKVKLQIKKTPFGQGEFSIAYHCRAKPNCADVYFNTALKQSKTPVDKTFYFRTIQKNTLAILLAKEYNKAVEKIGLDKKLRLYFTRVLVAKVGSQYFLLEAFIPGEFEKYTNNFEYVNENVPFLTAFSHFCYHLTDGKYMVTDLQGSNNLLTDPVIHSASVEFASQADLGLKGMVAFFRHHECNEYCAKLKLPPHEAQKMKGAIYKEPVKFDIGTYYKKCNYYFCNKNAMDESMCSVCKAKVDMSKAW